MLEILNKELPPDVVVLEIKGKITIGRESKQLEWAVENLVRDGRKKVIFDMSGVTNIDSTGIGIIVMSSGQLKKAELSVTMTGSLTVAIGTTETVVNLNQTQTTTVMTADKSFVPEKK